MPTATNHEGRARFQRVVPGSKAWAIRGTNTGLLGGRARKSSHTEPRKVRLPWARFAWFQKARNVTRVALGERGIGIVALADAAGRCVSSSHEWDLAGGGMEPLELLAEFSMSLDGLPPSMSVAWLRSPTTSA